MKIKSDAIQNYISRGSDPLGENESAFSGAGPSGAGVPAAPARTRKAWPGFLGRLKKRGWYRAASAVFAVCLCAALIALMMFTVMDMPYFGTADTLVESEVSAFYVENTLKDTSAVNIISGIILNYRGFDTLGESHVLFIAVCSVLILLQSHPSDAGARLRAYDYDDGADEPHDDEILKTGARVLVPLIFMFGVYIIVNGNLSPGGGFSGGAVIGAGLILYLSVFGYPQTRRFFTQRTFRAVSCAALVCYSLSKGYHFFTGANGLASGIPTGTPGSIFSGGLLLPLNVFVGAVVACTMYALFTMFRKGDF